MVPFYVIGKVQYVFASRRARRRSARSFSLTSFPYLASSLPAYFLFSDSSPATHSRRLLRSENVQTFQHSNPQYGSRRHLRDAQTSFTPKSLPFNLFADHHPLTPVTSIFYKNAGGRGHSRRFLSPKAFSCNTYGSPRKCCKQKTYSRAKPFRCNTYKKQGGYILQAKRLSPSAPFLQFGRSNVSTCKRFDVFPSYPLSFQPFTDSLTQRETRICFSFNHLRTLSIATEGVPPSSHFGTHPLRIPRSPCSTIPLIFIQLRGTHYASPLFSYSSV